MYYSFAPSGLACHSSPLSLRSPRPLRKVSTRYYSPGPPPPSVQGRSMLPYFIGGVGGITAVALLGYGYYHFSGAKTVVDGVRAAKDRYVETKAAIAEKSEVARDKMSDAAATAHEVARQKRTDLSERWDARLARKPETSKEESEDK